MGKRKNKLLTRKEQRFIAKLIIVKLMISLMSGLLDVLNKTVQLIKSLFS